MRGQEEFNFYLLFEEFIDDHDMNVDEIKQFQEDIEEIINNVCCEKIEVKENE